MLILSIFDLAFSLFNTFIAYFWPFNQYDHFSPHRSAGFEGYYTRVQLDDGGSLAIIFCWVKGASKRRNLVHVSYTPFQNTSGSVDAWPDAFKYEFYPEVCRVNSPLHRKLKSLGSFSLEALGIGSMEVTPGAAEYKISVPDHDLEVTLGLTRRAPWSARDTFSSPMGPFIHLSRSLPLNWHVHSIGSDAIYTIKHAGRTRTGQGLAHMEKNWGTSFPTGWLWTQSFGEGGERFTMAGGAALPGLHAYLLGYRSSKCEWDFRPPFTISVGPFSPLFSVQHDSRNSVVNVTARTLFRTLIARVEAPTDSFIGLACPLKDGHRPNFAFESFSGRTWIEAWQRRWPWGEWQCIEKKELGNTAQDTPSSVLEFGGSFSHLVMSAEETAS